MPKGSNWKLIYSDFNPTKQGLRETLCTLGNGYFCTRGAFAEEKADDFHYPGTYLAGGYNRLTTEISGREIENEDLVNFPNWLPLSFRIDGGDWFHLKGVNILDFQQELDVHAGVLERTIRFRDAHDRETTLKDRRLVHMHHFHLAAIEMTLTAENWSGQMEICSALDGTVKNQGVKRYRTLNSQHLVPITTEILDNNRMFLKVQTTQSELTVALGAFTQISANNGYLTIEPKNIQEEGYVAQHYSHEMKQGEPLKIEKIVSLYTSKDHAITECGREAVNALNHPHTFEELLVSHARAWDNLWRRFDIEIETTLPKDGLDPQLILRLHFFHTLQTASLNSIEYDIGIPARGWHGEAYRGHVFWDELFIFPILNFSMPEITRSLLQYRYRRLDRARQQARKDGYKGAMYPWQSGSNGREESQQMHLNPKSGRWIPDRSHVQRHVNSAIAYNVWRYYQVSGNLEFLLDEGAAMILEIAQFWSSIAHYNPKCERYEIEGVMGPDEYHDGYPNKEEAGLKNNAYTNIMAVWVLCRALEILEILPENARDEVCQRLHITADDIARWDQVSRKMHIAFFGDGIISQFEGYDDLTEFPFEEYRKKYENIQRLDRILESEGDTPNRYKLSKQADVLMLFFFVFLGGAERTFPPLGLSTRCGYHSQEY